MLILLLLFCNNGNGNKNCDNNCPDGSFGATPFNNNNRRDFRDGCYDECDLRNMTTPFHHAQSNACDLEFIIIIILFFMFKQMNGPISAVPVAETRARTDPFHESFNNNFFCE